MNHRRTAANTMLVATSASILAFIAPNAAGAESLPDPSSATTAGSDATASLESIEVVAAAVTAPVISNVTNLRQAVSVTWTASSGEGVVAYHLMALRSGVIKSQQIVSADVLQGSLSGLTNGLDYDIVVMPYTSTGAGSPSASVEGTPSAEASAATAASAVQNISVIKGKNFATLAWAPSANDGGSPIAGYAVVAIDQSNGSVAAWRNVRADVRNSSVSLPGGKTYDLYVVAVTGTGFGTVAPALHAAISSASLTVAKAPLRGWATAVPTADGEHAIVSYGPATERGDAVTRYHVIVVQDGIMTDWKAESPDSRQVIVPLGDNGPAQIWTFAESASGFGTFEPPIYVSN